MMPARKTNRQTFNCEHGFWVPLTWPAVLAKLITFKVNLWGVCVGEPWSGRALVWPPGGCRQVAAANKTHRPHTGRPEWPPCAPANTKGEPAGGQPTSL